MPCLSCTLDSFWNLKPKQILSFVSCFWWWYFLTAIQISIGGLACWTSECGMEFYKGLTILHCVWGGIITCHGSGCLVRLWKPFLCSGCFSLPRRFCTCGKGDQSRYFLWMKISNKHPLLVLMISSFMCVVKKNNGSQHTGAPCNCNMQEAQSWKIQGLSLLPPACFIQVLPSWEVSSHSLPSSL